MRFSLDDCENQIEKGARTLEVDSQVLRYSWKHESLAGSILNPDVRERNTIFGDHAATIRLSSRSAF
jgi:hypothetical protein